MSGSTGYITANPFLRFAAGDRLIRAVTGMPGVITDGEYDLETLGAAALDAGAVALIAASKPLTKLAKSGRFDYVASRIFEMFQDEAPGSAFLILDKGVAALGAIDMANGAGAPDEGGDFRTAADLLDSPGSDVAAAGPDAARWGGVAAAGYGDRTRAVMSDVDALQELDRQMQTLMARQADAVQKAHLTVAGGMNTLVLCYPIALAICLRGGPSGFRWSMLFQIAAVSAVLGGVLTMEYLAVDESGEVGRQVNLIAARYRALFQPGPGSDGTVTAESESPSVPVSSAMPTVARLAARADDGRAEQLRSLLNLLTAGPVPDADPDADGDPGTELSSPAATRPANPAPPAGADRPTPRTARPSAAQRRAGTAVAHTEEPQSTTETVDQRAPRAPDDADTAAAGGVQRAGTGRQIVGDSIQGGRGVGAG